MFFLGGFGRGRCIDSSLGPVGFVGYSKEDARDGLLGWGGFGFLFRVWEVFNVVGEIRWWLVGDCV